MLVQVTVENKRLWFSLERLWRGGSGFIGLRNGVALVNYCEFMSEMIDDGVGIDKKLYQLRLADNISFGLSGLAS